MRFVPCCLSDRRCCFGEDGWPRFEGAGGELQLTDAIRLLLQKEKVYGYRFEGKRHDAGDKLGFLKATVEFALKRPELRDEFRQYLRELQLWQRSSGQLRTFQGKF